MGRFPLLRTAVLGAVLCSTGPAWAVRPRRVELNRPEDLLRGTATGVSIRSDGALQLAPKIRPIDLQPDGGNPQPFTWCQTLDSRGRLYVGTGNEGRVFRVTPSGGSRPFLQIPEIEVTAIAVDERDRLYVAGSPPGRIYRVTPEGESTLFFEFEDRYVWALQMSPGGDLYAATGERGILYRISPGGQETVVLDSVDPHIVSLALGPDRKVYAGTAGRGLVYRIGNGGETRLVYESGADEVSALQVSPESTLYLGLLERKAAEAGEEEGRERHSQERDKEEEPVGGLPPGGLGEEMLSIGAEPEAFRRREKAPGPERLGSRILSLSPDGTIRPLWADDREIVYSLLFHDNALYAGTGPSLPPPGGGDAAKPAGPPRADVAGGSLRRIVGPDRHTLVARVPESQVTSLAARGEGIYAGTSNLGALYWVDPAPVDSGTFTSAPIDAGLRARWGRIWWRGRAPNGARIRFHTRTGPSTHPEDGWDPWKEAEPEEEGGRVASAPGRYLQWRLQIDGPTPEIREVGVSLLQDNAPPSLEKLEVRPPERAGREPGPEDRSGAASSPGKAEGSADPAPEGEVGSGWRIHWEASDPNGDRLEVRLDYRGESEGSWSLLAKGLRDSPHRWEPGPLADGRYRIRARASDAPDNPPDRTLTDEATSPTFVVDRTPPLVSLAPPERQGGSIRIEAVITDNLSGIESLRYSIEPGVWIPVFPVDGIGDSKREEVRIVLDRLPDGEHLLRLQATDASHNVGSETIPIAVDR